MFLARRRTSPRESFQILPQLGLTFLESTHDRKTLDGGAGCLQDFEPERRTDQALAL